MYKVYHCIQLIDHTPFVTMGQVNMLSLEKIPEDEVQSFPSQVGDLIPLHLSEEVLVGGDPCWTARFLLAYPGRGQFFFHRTIFCPESAYNWTSKEREY